MHDILHKYSPRTSSLDDAKKSARIDSKENGLESELKRENVYKDEYLQELLDKYASRSAGINRRIHEATIKTNHHKERRLQAERSIEARLKQHLSITDVAIPEPEEEEEEAKEVLLPDMTDDMERVVESALKSGGVTLVEAYKIPITGKDVNTLRGLNWLNDEVINFYMQMIAERSSNNEKGWPKVLPVRR